MTREEAIRKLLMRFKVDACCIASGDDERTYAPHPDDLAVMSVVIGKTITEEDLQFNVGVGYSSPYFYLPVAAFN